MCQVYFFSPLLRQLLEKLICVLYIISSNFRAYTCACACVFCFVKHKASPLPRNVLHLAFPLLNIVFKEILWVTIWRPNILISAKGCKKNVFHLDAKDGFLVLNSPGSWIQTIYQSSNISKHSLCFRGVSTIPLSPIKQFIQAKYPYYEIIFYIQKR